MNIRMHAPAAAALVLAAAAAAPALAGAAWPGSVDMLKTGSNATLPTARTNLGGAPILNAKSDYGALGNNSANDGPALANALRGCDQNHPLYLPPGRYKTQQQLYAPANCRFYGDQNGNWLIGDTPNTEIVADNTAGAFAPTGFTASISGNSMSVTAISAGSLAVGNPVSGTGVSGFTYITACPAGGCNTTGSYTVNNSQTVASEAMTSVPAVLTLGQTTTLSHIEVAGDNVAGHADAIDIAGSDVRLNHVVTATAGTYGVYCHGGGAQIVSIEDSIIGNSAGTGLGSGVYVSCPDSKIIGSFVKYNAGTGLYINTSHIRVVGNKIEGNSNFGAEICCGNTDVAFVGNDVADNAYEGLYLSGFGGTASGWTITGNVFDHNGTGQSAALDCHVRVDYSVANLVMAANSFNASGSPTTPNYVWCDSDGSSPGFTGGSVINDLYANQAIGVYESTVGQAAVQKVIGSKKNAVTVLCHAVPNTSSGADTTEDTLATCNVPANVIGANGQLRVSADFTESGAGGNKTTRIRYSGASGAAIAFTTNVAGLNLISRIANANATNAQEISGRFAAFNRNAGGMAAAPTTSAVDTTAATSVVITCQKVSGSDTCTLNDYTVELIADGT